MSFTLLETAGLAGLLRYQEKINERLRGFFGELEDQSPLRQACEYALMSEGKRMRPAVVLIIADALGQGADAIDAALAIEFFHTASLVVDDLPCMDDDDERRNRPSLHKVHGEAVAVLASYALISGGYELLQKNSEGIKKRKLPFADRADLICSLAVQNVSHNTGLAGACFGQLFDVFPPDLSLETIKEVFHKKTVTLFEVAFVLGWLYGGGAPEKLEMVKKLAYHFGMAFQIADDLQDIDQDVENERQINSFLLLGEEKARAWFQEEIGAYHKTMDALELKSKELNTLADLIAERAQKK